MVIFLPGQLAFKDGFGNDVYVVLATTNFIMFAGQQVTPVIYGDGGHCTANIFLSGVEVPAP